MILQDSKQWWITPASTRDDGQTFVAIQTIKVKGIQAFQQVGICRRWTQISRVFIHVIYLISTWKKQLYWKYVDVSCEYIIYRLSMIAILHIHQCAVGVFWTGRFTLAGLRPRRVVRPARISPTSVTRTMRFGRIAQQHIFKHSEVYVLQLCQMIFLSLSLFWVRGPSEIETQSLK